MDVCKHQCLPQMTGKLRHVGMSAVAYLCVLSIEHKRKIYLALCTFDCFIPQCATSLRAFTCSLHTAIPCSYDPHKEARGEDELRESKPLLLATFGVVRAYCFTLVAACMLHASMWRRGCARTPASALTHPACAHQHHAPPNVTCICNNCAGCSSTL